MADNGKEVAFSELKEWMKLEFAKSHANQEEILTGMRTRLDIIDGELFEVRKRGEQLEKENQELRKTVTEQRDQLNQLEASAKKENLRFFNIKEGRRGNTEEELRSFMANQLEIDHQSIEFSAIYRIGLSNVVNDEKKPRCILARFVRRTDRDNVLRAARNLRGTKFGIAEDLPRDWVEARRKAHQAIVKPAKQQKKQVRWRGQNLFIDGVEVDLTAKPQRSPRGRARTGGDRRRNRQKQKAASPVPDRSSSSSNTDRNSSSSSRESDGALDETHSSDSLLTLTQSRVDLREHEQQQRQSVPRRGTKSSQEESEVAVGETSGRITRSKNQQKLDRYYKTPRK